MRDALLPTNVCKQYGKNSRIRADLLTALPLLHPGNAPERLPAPVYALDGRLDPFLALQFTSEPVRHWNGYGERTAVLEHQINLLGGTDINLSATHGKVRITFINDVCQHRLVVYCGAKWHHNHANKQR